MKLEDLFQRLSRGELSNLALGNEGTGTIDETNQPKLIDYTNDGLLRLYSRFLLKEKDVLIEQQAHVTNYHLIPRFSRAGAPTDTTRYIMDLHCSTFTGDLIKILEVYDSFGRARILNDKECYESLYTPQPHVLQVPYPCAGEALSVSYQASHRVMGITDLKVQIEVPLFLEAALQTYVAHKVYSHMNGQENVAKSQEYAAGFEALCAEVEQKDLVNNTFATTNTKFQKRGFV